MSIPGHGRGADAALGRWVPAFAGMTELGDGWGVSAIPKRPGAGPPALPAGGFGLVFQIGPGG